jgi:hypothetical protein
MNERLVAYTFSVADPTEGSALGNLCLYFMLPFPATLVYASAAPFADDSGATMDLHDDGVAIISALACATKNAPGEWATDGYGGDNAPVSIAAGSEMTVDFNSAAAANRFDVQFLFLTGEGWN